MEQHPIPQQISSYEFHLVGDMTLKQFLKLAGGVLTAYLVYNSKLIFILRFPLSLILLLLGIGMAFFPINERPLEFWLAAFLKAIYSPTIYLWRKPFRSRSPARSPAPTKIGQLAPPQIKTKLPPQAAPSPRPTVAPTAPPPPLPQPKPSPKPPALSAMELANMIKKTTQQPAEPSTSPDFLERSLPATPTLPNIINGLVMDDKKRSVEGAIVEIQNMEGSPMRAMRTNALGQFQTATPLPNGKYLVLAEKEPYRFDIIKIETKGEVIPPLQIQAKKQQLTN